MKKILLLLMLLYAGATQAQTFEGIITWSIKSEITDPETKAKMEAAQQKMKDPANQAKMKEMQAKMDDPQFKKMMESNPQLKAQMEAMMKMSGGEGEGDPMSAMMPKSFLVKIKGSDVLTKMEGGIMGNMEILFLKDKDQSYRIDRSSKTYSVLSQSSAEKIASEQDVKVTKTGETTKVLGYTCTKYIVETTHKEQTAQQILWTTTDIKGIDLKSMSRQHAGDGSWYFDKVDGVPLKMEITHPHGKMVMEATELKKQSLPPSDFVIPAGFKEVQPVYGK